MFVSSSLIAQNRIVESFDAGWRFFKGDSPGAEASAFDDSKWRRVDTPHDWSIEGPFDAKNPTGGGGGFLPAGVGWYRKQFTLSEQYKGRLVFIEFDGVMANSDVWINGVHLGKRPYGYISFAYELTKHLLIGKNKTNVLAVRADNSGQPASRWYTGAGIYRHVRLTAVNRIHLAQWQTYVATPRISEKEAVVRIQGQIVNQSDKPADIGLNINAGGAAATKKLKMIPPGGIIDFREDVIVKAPKLWNLDQPNLYKAKISISSGKQVLDRDSAVFGIRDAQFIPETGFWLNGKNIKIKGVCLHHDGSAFGAAVPLRVWERRLERLRELGVNAIRTAHNPPAPEFLDLCDRMGFLVMDELFDCWTVGKTKYDYHLYFNEWSKIDLRDTVLRDRNHPCIILYSAGNEIHDTPKEDLAKQILAGLVEVFHQYDPSRPVTQALFRPNVSHDYDNGLADLLDVVGTNYRDLELLAAYKAKPTRKIVGTEQRHELATWIAARDNVQHSGQFLWSGIDYLGESFRWPIIAAGSGLLDRTGEIKAMAYERQSWWSDKPVVHVVRRVNPPQAMPTDPGFAALFGKPTQLADWTPDNVSAHEETVESYSNCEEVELFLNGKSLGSKPRNADDSPRVWKIAFEPGALKSVGRNRGAIVAEHELRTAGKPEKIVLAADRSKLTPDWNDVVFISATVTDKDGIQIPGASDLVSFKISGPGVIAAVDSGDNSSAEPFQASSRKAYQGRCYAMIKTQAMQGKITVTASADGLQGASVSIEVAAADGAAKK
jgi:beta-galactosidase